jgi:hypothetical protein
VCEGFLVFWDLPLFFPSEGKSVPTLFWLNKKSLHLEDQRKPEFGCSINWL